MRWGSVPLPPPHMRPWCSTPKVGNGPDQSAGGVVMLVRVVPVPSQALTWAVDENTNSVTGDPTDCPPPITKDGGGVRSPTRLLAAVNICPDREFIRRILLLAPSLVAIACRGTVDDAL